MSSRRNELEANLRSVEAEVASYAPTLIVVTKTYPVSDVEALRELGAENFGENRSSEGVEKSAQVPATWHYQGEVQSKKLREIIGWADCIHSLDNEGHWEKIARIASEIGRPLSLFLQLSLDGDPVRGGAIEADLFELAAKVAANSDVTLLGMMCVPPVSLEPQVAFAKIAEAHRRFIAEFPQSPYLSAGMSGDYVIALDHGATHIRVGSKILGPRQYH
jgi:pyridoxal phosphate enzyme (YggS family)